MNRFLAAALALCAPAVAFADVAPEPIESYKEAPISGGLLLIIAYFVMWLALAAFVARTALKQSKLEAELRALEHKLDGGKP